MACAVRGPKHGALYVGLSKLTLKRQMRDTWKNEAEEKVDKSILRSENQMC